MMQKGGYVYITTNKTHSVLYIGVTANIGKRISEHKDKLYLTALRQNIIAIF